MPDPDLTDAALRALLELAEKVRKANPRSATAQIAVLSPDMAAAVLRELLETREVLAQVIEVSEGFAVESGAPAVLREARTMLERRRKV